MEEKAFQAIEMSILQSRHISDFLNWLAHVILHESFKFVSVAIWCTIPQLMASNFVNHDVIWNYFV